MIKRIYGIIESIKKNYAVVKVDKIGYQVFFNEVLLGKLAKQKGEVEIFVHTYVREDQISLYGFLEENELEMFELLISISGIGPKAAMGILNIASPKMIKSAIINEDSSILTTVSGVGKKTAERVILELQNKIGDLSEVDDQMVKSEGEIIEALLVMGYNISEAREAIKQIPLEVKDISEKIKWALKLMR